jgi:hypothetical protein
MRGPQAGFTDSLLLALDYLAFPPLQYPWLSVQKVCDYANAG